MTSTATITKSSVASSNSSTSTTLPNKHSTKSASKSEPFIRNLASSSLQTRRRALSTLRTYLQSGKKFTHTDFLKLWKGLFYCLYMTPGARVQQSLCRELGELVGVLYDAPRRTTTSQEGEEEIQGGEDEEDADRRREQEETVVSFISAFWETMAREWSGLDKHRLDKFLFLCRVYIRAGFSAVLDLSSPSTSTASETSEQRTWSKDLLDRYLTIIETGPLNPRDQKIPNGLRFHVMDIWVDELCEVDTEKTIDLALAMRPIRKTAKESPLKHVRKRAEDVLGDERLDEWDDGSKQTGIDDDTGMNGQAETENNGQKGDKDEDGAGDDWAGFED